jgi:hypothetical protein
MLQYYSSIEKNPHRILPPFLDPRPHLISNINVELTIMEEVVFLVFKL